ncbi:MAG: SdiA-regulated domain-containing protein [Kiritimatiellae bacterium]|nr:SdiA-regulated domain-containing protein [Kiritimatiellia bacterium]
MTSITLRAGCVLAGIGMLALRSPAVAQGSGSEAAKTGAPHVETLTLKTTVREIVKAKESLGHADCVVMPSAHELLVVDNHGRKTIDVLSLDGRYKRTMPTQGFPDMEGLVHVSGNTFAAIDEKDREITLLTITAMTPKITKASGKTYPLDLPDSANNGLEGITSDPDNKCFYVVNEGPLAVYKVVLAEGTAEISTLFDAKKKLAGHCRDLLDLTYDRVSRHLFFLSDESEVIVETDMEGAVLSKHPIPAGLPEGIAFSPDRSQLYLIDQKGILYIYDVKWAGP